MGQNDMTVERGTFPPNGTLTEGKHGGATSLDVELAPRQYPLSLIDVNRAIYGVVASHHEWALNNVRETSWLTNHWTMEAETHRIRAGQALAAGAPGFVEFGNFKALVFHPDKESMRTVNAAKGRDLDQVASVVTTREHIEGLFDWSKLQGGLTKEGVMEMIHAFYDRSEANPHAPYAGPFGFRGPAAEHIPDHLTSPDPTTGLPTVQLIAPGYECLSNEVIAEALKAMKARSTDQHTFLAITSANPSSHRTGKDEPAHYLRRGIQEEFHDYEPGIFIMGHADEATETVVREQYPNHEPNSTTILDFSRAEAGDYGWPRIHMARHGSLPDDLTRMVVNSMGMELAIDEQARPSLKLREYDPTFIKAKDMSNAHITPTEIPMAGFQGRSFDLFEGHK
jgi:hypothetical protein